MYICSILMYGPQSRRMLSLVVRVSRSGLRVSGSSVPLFGLGVIAL